MAETSLTVFKNSIPAALLSGDGGQVTFRYLESYVTRGLEPISWSLPLSLEPKVYQAGATPAFFAGLLPEGRRLNAIAGRLKTSPDNEVALLAALGSDAIGDVQLAEGENLPAEREVLLLPKDTTTLDFAEIQSKYFGSPAAGLPGFQDKISSKMLNAPAKQQGLEYIMKFNPPEAPFAVENEYLFLSLAKNAGLSVSSFRLLTDSKGEHALLLQRFDRLRSDGRTHRLAMEDACQVLDVYPSRKYQLSFEEVAVALIEKCSAKKPAALELFKQIVFYWLIGNGDAHAKNFSILKNLEGEWRISPAYDILCTLYYQDVEMALSVSDKTTLWDRETLLVLGEQLGVPDVLAQQVIEHLLAKTERLTIQLDTGGLPFRPDQNYKVTRALRNRRKRLESKS